MIPLEKQANATDCQDFQTISLISHASKIMFKILTKRPEGKARAVKYITEEQFGFWKGMGTRDAIGVLRSWEKEVYSTMKICTSASKTTKRRLT